MHLVRGREKPKKQEQKEPGDCWNIEPSYNSRNVNGDSGYPDRVGASEEARQCQVAGH